jgi:hypothetical protein
LESGWASGVAGNNPFEITWSRLQEPVENFHSITAAVRDNVRCVFAIVTLTQDLIVGCPGAGVRLVTQAAWHTSASSREPGGWAWPWG